MVSKETIESQLAEYRAQFELAKNNANALSGAIQALEKLLKSPESEQKLG